MISPRQRTPFIIFWFNFSTILSEATMIITLFLSANRSSSLWTPCRRFAGLSSSLWTPCRGFAGRSSSLWNPCRGFAGRSSNLWTPCRRVAGRSSSLWTPCRRVAGLSSSLWTPCRSSGIVVQALELRFSVRRRATVLLMVRHAHIHYLLCSLLR